jgi:hypothetical protein
MNNTHISYISSSFFNKHTNKVILFNEHIDKIIILKELTESEIFKNIEELKEELKKEEETKKFYYTKAKLNKFKELKTIEKISNIYFNQSNEFDYMLFQKLIFKLVIKEYILIPFSLYNTTFLYLNLRNEKKLEIFQNNKEIYTFINYLDSYLKQMKNKSYANMIYKFFQRIIFSTNISSLSDLSSIVFDFYIYLEQKYSKRTNNSSKNTLGQLKNIFSDYYLKNINKYNWNEEYILKEFKKYVYFNDYYKEEKIKEINIQIANEFCNFISSKFKQIDNHTRGIKLFFDYLINTKNNDKELYEIKREIHIKDISGKNNNLFFNLIENLDNSSVRKNSILQAVQEFFEYAKEEHYNNFFVPINKYDRFFTKSRNSITTRNRVPSSIINIAKEILFKNDFEFNRKFQDENTQLSLISNGEKDYWYGYTIVMYILLTYPIRNKQSRWLDSGELDEFIIDFDKMEYIKNNNPYSIKGRKEGCLQIETDYFSGKKYYILWINTNKTGKSYKIPYVPEDILKMIKLQIEWNRKNLTVITKPIKAIEKNVDIRRNSKVVEDSVPLFLYPQLMNRKAFKPISDRQIHKFYYHLMLEVEKEILKIENKEIRLTKTHKATYKSRNNDLEINKTVFDIHSLRVSGITNLIEAGVPVEIVSQFVAGHASTVMTLYYNKNSIEEITTAIDKLHNEKQLNLKDDLEKFESAEEFEKQLFSATQEFKTNEIYQACEDTKGYWNIGLSGICPVNCEELGRSDKCCPKCNYWITGTPFIIGQVTEINNLMYQIRQKAKKIQKLNQKYIETFSDQTKGQIELTNEEISNMIGEWGIRYKFIQKSLTLLNDKEKKNSNNTENTKDKSNILICHSNKLNLGISDTNDFGLAFNICKNNELIEEFENNEAQYELEFFINKILSNNDLEPFLYKLDREESLKVSNIFSKYILENYNYNHIEELIKGKIKLENDKIKELTSLISFNENNLIEHKGI